MRTGCQLGGFSPGVDLKGAGATGHLCKRDTGHQIFRLMCIASNLRAVLVQDEDTTAGHPVEDLLTIAEVKITTTIHRTVTGDNEHVHLAHIERSKVVDFHGFHIRRNNYACLVICGRIVVVVIGCMVVTHPHRIRAQHNLAHIG